MENNCLEIFNNPEFGQVRVLEIDGEHWFVGKDVAEALEFSNTRKAIADHVDEEDKMDGVTIRDSIGREQKPIIINESGLYSLIFGSKLDSAKRFKRWVTSEVLPALRKTGHYEVPGAKKRTSNKLELAHICENIIDLGYRPEEIPEAMSEVCEFLYGVPKKIVEAAEPVEPMAKPTELGVSEEFLHQYAEELRAAGIARTDRIVILGSYFREFCARKGIPVNKFRRWLHQNGYIYSAVVRGIVNYTVTVWMNGSMQRCVAFLPS